MANREEDMGAVHTVVASSQAAARGHTVSRVEASCGTVSRTRSGNQPGSPAAAEPEAPGEPAGATSLRRVPAGVAPPTTQVAATGGSEAMGGDRIPGRVLDEREEMKTDPPKEGAATLGVDPPASSNTAGVV